MSTFQEMELPGGLDCRAGLAQADRSHVVRSLKKLLTINPDAIKTDVVREMIEAHNITRTDLEGIQCDFPPGPVVSP